MNRITAIVITVLLSFSGIWAAQAQQVKLNASLDTSNVLIGDQVAYRLQLLIPEGYQFDWPLFADTLASNVEILKRTGIDTLRLKDGLLEVKQVFTITSFDTGFYVIPPFKVKYRETEQSGDLKFVESEPYLLNVFSIPVDLAQPIKPIKGPIAVPITFMELLPWILLLFLVAGLVYFFLIRKKKAAPITIFRSKPRLPAHIIALDALDQLKKEKLWQQGLIKDYYSRLSNIVREYIDERFDLPSVESTTYETMQMIKTKPVSGESMGLLKELLELSDLVKFAKAKPLPSEHDHCMNLAVGFVNNTSQGVSMESQSNAVNEGGEALQNNQNSALTQ